MSPIADIELTLGQMVQVDPERPIGNTLQALPSTFVGMTS